MPGDASGFPSRSLLPFAVQPPADDWPHLLSVYPNILITAPTGVADVFLQKLLPRVRKPVQVSRGGASLSWPTLSDGTFVLHDVDRLSTEQQFELVRRIDDCRGHIQFVAFSPTPLFALVEAGTFFDKLYYRMNAVYLTVEPLISDAA